MKRIARIISSIAIVTLIGCNRESRSTRGPDSVAQKSNTSGTAKVSPTGRAKTGAAEWERAFEERERQYEKVEELAKEVPGVCAGTNGEEAVDALLAKVSDLIDEYERGIWDKGNAMSSLTSFTAPFVRDVECYWTRRQFKLGKTPPGNLLNEVRLSHSLATKTVDLLQKKVGNSDVTAPFEIGNCSILKWLAHNFERAGWEKEKQYVDSMVENWIETRYDVLEGNPLKDACEDVEIDAARNPTVKSCRQQSIHERRTSIRTWPYMLSGGFPSGSRHGRKKWNGKTIPNQNKAWGRLCVADLRLAGTKCVPCWHRWIRLWLKCATGENL